VRDLRDGRQTTNSGFWVLNLHSGTSSRVTYCTWEALFGRKPKIPRWLEIVVEILHRTTGTMKKKLDSPSRNSKRWKVRADRLGGGRNDAMPVSTQKSGSERGSISGSSLTRTRPGPRRAGRLRSLGRPSQVGPSAAELGRATHSTEKSGSLSQRRIMKKGKSGRGLPTSATFATSDLT